jgi:hypothetical protein
MHTLASVSNALPMGAAFPDWTFSFRQSSFTHIARVLRHLILQHFRMTIAFMAGCCPLDLSVPGKPVTQEHSSKFFLAEPGISSCVTRRTLSGGRPSHVPSFQYVLARRRCPIHPLQDPHWISVTSRKVPVACATQQAKKCHRLQAF